MEKHADGIRTELREPVNPREGGQATDVRTLHLSTLGGHALLIIEEVVLHVGSSEDYNICGSCFEYVNPE